MHRLKLYYRWNFKRSFCFFSNPDTPSENKTTLLNSINGSQFFQLFLFAVVFFLVSGWFVWWLEQYTNLQNFQIARHIYLNIRKTFVSKSVCFSPTDYLIQGVTMMRNECYIAMVYIYISQKIVIDKKSKPYTKSWNKCQTAYLLNIYIWLKFLKLQSNYFTITSNYEAKKNQF